MYTNTYTHMHTHTYGNMCVQQNENVNERRDHEFKREQEVYGKFWMEEREEECK